MNTRRDLWASALLLLAAACAGLAARDHVLLPALQDAWPSVAREIDAGHPDAATVAIKDQADGALKAGDKIRIGAVSWPILRTAAEAGVAEMVRAGTVSPGVAGSLRERDRQFFGGINVYLER